MNDVYTEQLVKKQKGKREFGLWVSMLLLLLIGVVGTLYLPFGFVLLLAAAAGCIWIYRHLYVEYEYLFVNGDLDIDIIWNKSRRKRVFSMHVGELELLAPEGAVQMQPFQGLSIQDYSSGRRDVQKYCMVIRVGGQCYRVCIEPEQTILEGFSLLAPRKVVRT